MTDTRTRPTVDEVCAALKQIWPRDEICIGGYTQGFVTVIHVNAEPGEGISFRFADMERIAEACATEHLNFRSIQGADEVDSWTFDGSLLVIEARYNAPPPDTKEELDYKMGVDFGDRWIANGGDLWHELDATNEAYCHGFSDRLAKERSERKVPK